MKKTDEKVSSPKKTKQKNKTTEEQKPKPKRKDMNVPHRSKDQKCVIDKKKRLDRIGWGMTTYEESYPQIAFDILSSAPFKTKSHLCRAFHCSKPTLINWIRKHKAFQEAVECGLAAGEAMFRDKAQINSWNPNKDVNNGLIALLARNVYGIEKGSEVEINLGEGKVGPARSAEEEMAERGIPLPGLMVPDMDALIQTPLNEQLTPQGGPTNDRTGTDHPEATGNGAFNPPVLPIADMDDPKAGVHPPGALSQGVHGPGEHGTHPGGDGKSVEPGKKPTTDESRTSKGMAGEQVSKPLAGMDDAVESGSPSDIKRALKKRTETLIYQNMENEKLRTQIRALKVANANRIKEQASRVVAGFGNDFATSDGDVHSPFGDDD